MNESIKFKKFINKDIVVQFIRQRVNLDSFIKDLAEEIGNVYSFSNLSIVFYELDVFVHFIFRFIIKFETEFYVNVVEIVYMLVDLQKLLVILSISRLIKLEVSSQAGNFMCKICNLRPWDGKSYLRCMSDEK